MASNGMAFVYLAGLITNWHGLALIVEKQQELHQGQSMALEGLQSLTTILSQALQESRKEYLN